MAPPTEPVTEINIHCPAARWGVEADAWKAALSDDMIALLAPPVVVSAVRYPGPSPRTGPRRDTSPSATRRAGRAVPAVTVST